jgi:hypothetical protein
MEDFMIGATLKQDLGHNWLILQNRLTGQVQITPGSAFALSNQNLVAALSVLMTYLIVLVQFKLSGS